MDKEMEGYCDPFERWHTRQDRDIQVATREECEGSLNETITFEIFIQDLTDECREQLEEVIGKEHNYDVLPLATLEFETGGND